MSTTPAQYLIEFNRGDRLYRGFRFRYKDGTFLDLTGCSFACSVRADYDEAATPVYDLSPYLSVDLTPGVMRVKLDVPDSVTATMQTGRLFWGLVTTDSLGRNRTYVEGKFIVRPRVTVVS